MTTTSEPAGTPGAPGGGYPAAPPASGGLGPKVSATWTGAVMALGGIVAGIGTILPFEKLADSDGNSYQFTGLGSETVTGQASAAQFTPGNAGKIILVTAILALVLGGLVLARKGRLWVSIVGLVVGAVGVVMALAALAAPSSDAKDITAAEVTGSVGIGAILAVAGMAVATVAAIVALIARKRAQ